MYDLNEFIELFLSGGDPSGDASTRTHLDIVASYGENRNRICWDLYFDKQMLQYISINHIIEFQKEIQDFIGDYDH